MEVGDYTERVPRYYRRRFLPTTSNLQKLLDDTRYYETVRQLHWPMGTRCPHYDATTITQKGRGTTQTARRKYRCAGCHRHVDDLTGTVLARYHQPLRVYIFRLYFMGLNLSNAQITRELGLNPNDVQRVAKQLRGGIVARQPEPILAGEVECDEVHIVAGHKGHPLESEKLPILGWGSNAAGVVIRMLENVQQPRSGC